MAAVGDEIRFCCEVNILHDAKTKLCLQLHSRGLGTGNYFKIALVKAGLGTSRAASGGHLRSCS